MSTCWTAGPEFRSREPLWKGCGEPRGWETCSSTCKCEAVWCEQLQCGCDRSPDGAAGLGLSWNCSRPSCWPRAVVFFRAGLSHHFLLQRRGQGWRQTLWKCGLQRRCWWTDTRRLVGHGCSRVVWALGAGRNVSLLGQVLGWVSGCRACGAAAPHPAHLPWVCIQEAGCSLIPSLTGDRGKHQHLQRILSLICLLICRLTENTYMYYFCPSTIRWTLNQH